MASTDKPKRAFIVLVDDFSDPGALDRRLASRSEHLVQATRKHEKGVLVSAGAMLDSHESGRMVGSALTINADSEEEVMELLRSDPYTVGRAWNLDSVKIIPYRPASF
ncbi:hypothetical protein GGF46_000178 [Coemansia sp. RSA 552]|nr:hypothetical protein GGF46_000178 [Coemansia sp. RSA 552]